MGTLKEMWASLKRNPALLWTLIIVGAVIIYFVVRNAQTQTSPATTNAGAAGYFLVREEGEAPSGQPQPHPRPHPPAGTPPPQPHPGPTPGPPQQNPPTSGALIPPGHWPANIPIQFGQTIKVGSTTYTLGPGGNNRVWGVAGTGWNLADWNRVPIGPGGKVLLYQG